MDINSIDAIAGNRPPRNWQFYLSAIQDNRPKRRAMLAEFSRRMDEFWYRKNDTVLIRIETSAPSPTTPPAPEITPDWSPIEFMIDENVYLDSEGRDLPWSARGSSVPQPWRSRTWTWTGTWTF